MPAVNFSILNQLNTPAVYAAPFASRPAAGYAGRLFIDTNSPSTGIYRDTGSAWILIAAPGGGGGSGTVTTANNGLTLITGGTIAQLGQAQGEVGDPAALSSDREIPMNSKSIIFNFGTTNGKLRAQFNQNAGSNGVEVVNASAGASAAAQILFTNDGTKQMTFGIKSSGYSVPNQRFIDSGDGQFYIGDLTGAGANGMYLVLDNVGGYISGAQKNGYYCRNQISAGSVSWDTNYSNIMYWSFASNNAMNLNANGTLTLMQSGGIKTGAPSGGTAREWKLGDSVTAYVADGNAVQVEINGVVKYLLTAQPA